MNDFHGIGSNLIKRNVNLYFWKLSKASWYHIWIYIINEDPFSPYNSFGNIPLLKTPPSENELHKKIIIQFGTALARGVILAVNHKSLFIDQIFREFCVFQHRSVNQYLSIIGTWVQENYFSFNNFSFD